MPKIKKKLAILKITSHNPHSERVKDKMGMIPERQRAAEDGNLFFYKVLIM
jgi:hypothetical protein